MSLFGFNEDPFFGGGGPHNMMRQMDQMMSSMMRSPFEEDPFFGGHGAPAGPAFPSLMAPPQHAAAQRQVANRHRMSDPFSAMGMPNINNIMESMMNGAGAGAGGNNCHMYSSSSVMSMTTGPDGKPQVYQATSTSRGHPGGIREIRKTEADSRNNSRKMAIGHHIGERGHIIERESRNGEMEEKQEFLNIDEEEAPRFNDEYRREVQQFMGNPAIEYSPRHRNANSRHPYTSNVPAITNSNYSRRASPMLALTGGTSGGASRVRRRDREDRSQRPSRRY